MAGGDWWEFRSPFRHWRASSVLDPEIYDAVSAKFRLIVEQTQGRGPLRMSASTGNYDAQILALNADLAGWFSPFLEAAWIKSLHRFLRIPETHRIDAALHSSPPGSRTGWIHTDLCSAWFDEASCGDELSFANRAACDYFTGKTHTESARPKEYVRAATMIYYLCNEGWSERDGGETGLYGAAKLHDRTIVSRVPPVDNTLLLFECSPHSYHRFLTNPGRRRNSIILWLHTTVDAAEARWPNAVTRRHR